MKLLIEVEEDKKMTFEEYWKQVEETGILSRIAIRMMPNAFSEEVKVTLVKLDAEEVALMCQKVITEINAGSVEPVDELLKKRLNV